MDCVRVVLTLQASEFFAGFAGSRHCHQPSAQRRSGLESHVDVYIDSCLVTSIAAYAQLSWLRRHLYRPLVAVTIVLPGLMVLTLWPYLFVFKFQ